MPLLWVNLTVWTSYYFYIQAYPSVITYLPLNVWTTIQIGDMIEFLNNSNLDDQFSAEVINLRFAEDSELR